MAPGRVALVLAALCVAGALAEEVKKQPELLGAVRRLLEKPRLGLGLIGETKKAEAKLTVEQEQSFKMSTVDRDRQGVLNLEREMMEERHAWSQEADSKVSRLSKLLTAEKKKPAAPKTHRKRLSAIGLAGGEQAELNYERMVRVPKRNGAARKVSWGEMRKETSALRSGNKDYKNSPADPSWGDMLKEFGGGAAMKTEAKAEPAPVKGPLASFSWGEDEWMAKHGPVSHHAKKGLDLITKHRNLPDVNPVDMPDELDSFLNSGHNQDASEMSKEGKKVGNPYAMDLN